MKKQRTSINHRDLVLSILMEVDKQKEFSHVLLRRVLDKYDYLESREKAFIKRLTEGTLERMLELDYVIDQYSAVPVRKMKPLIRALLRMSAYQLLYMEQIPESAACNEAVKLAQEHRFASLKGFVNAVLRKIAKEKGRISYPDRHKSKKEFLSVTYSMPMWLVEHFLELYGWEKTEKILQAFLQVQPVSIRLKESLSFEEQERLKEEWTSQNIRIREHELLPYAFCAEGIDGVQTIAGFQEGMICVQDVSSMLAAEAAGIREGMHILDVCAAPGGKAAHAALKLKETGLVVARDVSEYKVEMIRENAARQELTNLICEVWDAVVFDESKKEWADLLFCDLPCSGLGVIGRKKEIKYRMSKEGMEELVLLQRKILQQVWSYVKPGGILMYSTCTINPKENEQQVKWILEHFPFELLPMKEHLPRQLQREEGNLGLQLLPGIQKTDGFFLARLRRKRKER